MHRLLAVISVLFFITASPAPAQDAAAILAKMREKQVERWEGVDNYLVDQTMMGNRIRTTFDRVTVSGVEGDTYDIFRQSMDDEDPCAAESQTTGFTAEQLDQMATGMEMTGEAMGEHLESEMAAMGLPPGLLGATGTDPWATFDPRGMFGGSAQLYRAAAEGKRQQEMENQMPDTTTSNLARYAESARVVGIEQIGGRDAYHLRADDLNIGHEGGKDEFTIQSVSLWIDTEEYVPLRMTMDGIAKSGAETRPVKMERLEMDYRKVPDSDMYESYRQVMRMSGVMSAEEEAEMREAREQLAEFDRQLAQMPASQRDMIMAQMGPQMDTLRQMASGSGVEIVTEVHDIIANYCDKTGAASVVTAVGPVSVPSAARPTAKRPPGGVSSGGSGASARPSAAGVAAGAAAAGTTASAFSGADDGVEVRPYYIDEEGIGVLRYSERKGRMFQYHLAISSLTADPDKPREVIVGQMGPYAGPDVAVYIGSLDMINVPLNLLEIELYETDPYRPVVRFRPVVDPDKAESKEDCGEVSATGACSNTVTEQ